MTINILFLSDLHFGVKQNNDITNSAISERKNVLENQLFPELKTFLEKNKEWKPNFVVITGDIAWSGNKGEYEQSKEWLRKLIKELNLKENDLVIAPGNHDIQLEEVLDKRSPVNRKEAEEMFKEKLKKLKDRFSNFIEFCKDLGISTPVFQEKPSYLVGIVNKNINCNNIRFIVLNSAWFHTMDDVKGKLWFGDPFLNEFEANNEIINLDKQPNTAFTISLMHHSKDWFNPEETDHPPNNYRSTYNHLIKRINIGLSGHNHKPILNRADKIQDNAYWFEGGASYEGIHYKNNFQILKIDLINKKLRRSLFKYDSQLSEWTTKIEKLPYDLSISQPRISKKIENNDIKPQLIDENLIQKSMDEYRTKTLYISEKIFKYNLSEFIKYELLSRNYGEKWKLGIPKSIIRALKDKFKEKISKIKDIDEFFDRLNLLHLKEIISNWRNKADLKEFFGKNSIEKINNEINDLYRIQRKALFHKVSISNIDFLKSLKIVKNLSIGNSLYNKNIAELIDTKLNSELDLSQFSLKNDIKYQTNLPLQDYDNDGGFVGRKNKIIEIEERLETDLDRIISITGAGGAGKSAIALKISYNYLSKGNDENPFEKIIWLSAKNTRLTEKGIVSFEPMIPNIKVLIKEIFNVVDSNTYEFLDISGTTITEYIEYLYNIFSIQRCLIIFDNLESVLDDDEILDFLKNIPNPSKLLITSRIGLGELERRVSIGDMKDEDAIELFDIFSRSRKKEKLAALSKDIKLKYVNKVKNYPLIIKWAIGKVCLGTNIEKAFSEIYSGKSDIAQFAFNDVFNMLSNNSKNVLFCMIIFDKKHITRAIIQHLTDFDDKKLDDSIRQLLTCSFIYSIGIIDNNQVKYKFQMLDLTRGFIENELDKYPKEKAILLSRYQELSKGIKISNASASTIKQTYINLGIASAEDKIAINHIITANLSYKLKKKNEARNHYKKAEKIAPNNIYVLVEYSKFEFKERNYKKSLELCKKATELEPNNIYVWSEYGKQLKHKKEYIKAKEAILNGLKIDPNNLNLLTEYGWLLTNTDNYEQAKIYYEKALIDQSHPNYKHMSKTLRYQAENYYRWAVDFDIRGDYIGQQKILNQSLIKIRKAIKINPNNKEYYAFYRKIRLKRALTFKTTDVKKSIEELKEILRLIKTRNFVHYPSSDLCSEAYYYLAKFSIEEEKSLYTIKKYIRKGLVKCSKGSKWNTELMSLKIKINKEKKHGKIKIINYGKKYGVIKEESGETYLFFIDDLKDKKILVKYEKMKNIPVSFKLRRNYDPNKDNQLAIEIHLEKKIENDNIVPYDEIIKDE